MSVRCRELNKRRNITGIRVGSIKTNIKYPYMSSIIMLSRDIMFPSVAKNDRVDITFLTKVRKTSLPCKGQNNENQKFSFRTLSNWYKESIISKCY